MKSLLPPLTASCLLVAGPVHAASPCQEGDILYVGDQAVMLDLTDDIIAKFDAETGEYCGNLVSSSPGLNGPRGMIFAKQGGPTSDLLVASQNVDIADDDIPATNSAVLRFDRFDGEQHTPLVPITHPNGIFNAQGVVLGKQNIVYVADAGDDAPVFFPGRITRWRATTGNYLGDLDASGFTAGDFRPRGMVFGPDGYLYVAAAIDCTTPSATCPATGGAIVRFDTKEDDLDIVYHCDPDDLGCDLHRPSGLAFGPDGRLYVTSFRRAATDVDRILIFDILPEDDTPVSIPLGGPGTTRSFAQALVFGPGGYLFVPITGGVDVGAVRRYDVDSPSFSFTNFVPPGGPLLGPWYLTFGETDPATLAYDD